MKTSTRLAEHWTVTGERIVITGSETVITDVARSLDVPLDEMVRLGKAGCALPLWGNALHKYLADYHSGQTPDSGPPIITDALIPITVV